MSTTFLKTKIGDWVNAANIALINAENQAFNIGDINSGTEAYYVLVDGWDEPKNQLVLTDPNVVQSLAEISLSLYRIEGKK